MGLTGLLLGGAGIAIVGSALANGQGGSLLEFGQNALSGIMEFFQNLFNKGIDPDKAAEERQESIGNIVNGNQIQTADEMKNRDVFNDYSMEDNLQKAVETGFSFSAGNNGSFWQNENEIDAKEIAMTMALRGGFVAMEGDTALTVEETAAKLEPTILEGLNKNPNNMDDAIKYVTDSLEPRLGNADQLGDFMISSERAVMGNDTYNAVYNSIQGQRNENTIDKEKLRDDIVNDVLEKRGLPVGLDEDTAREQMNKIVDGAIAEVGTDSPKKLAVSINSGLEVNGIKLEGQEKILSNFSQQKVSGQLAQNMTTTPEGGKPSSVEQATAGAKEMANNGQKTDKNKEVSVPER